MVRIVGAGARELTDVRHQDHERPSACADNPDKVERGPGAPILASPRLGGLPCSHCHQTPGPSRSSRRLGALVVQALLRHRRRRSPRDLWGYLSPCPLLGAGLTPVHALAQFESFGSRSPSFLSRSRRCLRSIFASRAGADTFPPWRSTSALK